MYLSQRFLFITRFWAQNRVYEWWDPILEAPDFPSRLLLRYDLTRLVIEFYW